MKHPSRSTGSPRCPFLADRSQGTLRLSPRRFYGGALGAATRAARGGPGLTKDGFQPSKVGAPSPRFYEQRSRERTAVVLHRFGGGALDPRVARGASAAPRAAALVKRLGRPLQSHDEPRRLIGSRLSVGYVPGFSLPGVAAYGDNARQDAPLHPGRSWRAMAAGRLKRGSTGDPITA